MFREDFVWGAASSAYQIEGKDKEDGAGECIWDRFVKEKGRITDGADADVSCDFVHKYKEDISLMKYMGIKHYRFSLNWSRIMPEGTGKVNEKAVKMYRDMILFMKEKGIEPFISLFHWEYPQRLQEQGGWVSYQSPEWFGEYAKVAAENFSDICKNFITIDEPQCFCNFGHVRGTHAPGYRLPLPLSFQMVHNILKAHGRAVQVLRKYADGPVKIGIAPTYSVPVPCTEEAADIEAARRAYFGFYEEMDNWAWNLSWYLDPILFGKYPEKGMEKFAPYLPRFSEEDMDLISQPIDFIGQGIYNGYAVRADQEGEPEVLERKPGAPKTAVGWSIMPECMYWGCKFLYERYKMPVIITENGMSALDVVSEDGRVHDQNRIHYLDAHISQMQRAYDEGIDIRGYFLWTFLDNFEWERGYSERFGIVYVDFENKKRTVKDSAYWYQKVMSTNGRNLSINRKPRPILFLNPVLKEMVWGGSRLGTDFGYQLPGNEVGECWGISAHPNGDDGVDDNRFVGKTLSELWEEDRYLFGNLKEDRFPLLVKVIDAKQNLSIQVHPDDSYAKEHEGGSLGKTECWYIIDCEEGAELVVGHNARTKEELEDMIYEGKWDAFIRRIPIRKGDFIQIDPGTVHAITGGCMILETQQNSDITYRVYDYGRLKDGKPRELHVEKSIDVIEVPAKPARDSVKNVKEIPENQWVELIACDYYKVYKMNLNGMTTFEQTTPFMNISVIEGCGIVNGRVIKKGDHFILPDGYGNVELAGEMELIASTV